MSSLMCSLMRTKKLILSPRLFCVWLVLLLPQLAYAGQGKLIGTAGLSQVEGVGGGGIVPWATLLGYDSEDEISLTASLTQVSLPDYRLHTLAAGASFYDAIEVSVARQTFDLTTLGGEINQQIIAAKYKLYGDVVYADFPQISIGIQHKSLQNKAIANALGAESFSGTDLYITATKVHLGAVFGYNAVWSAAVRATKANEMGLLGFGSVAQNSHELMFEASAGILLSRHLAIGAEYRQKPDNLGLGEDDWIDVFVSYIPTKSFHLTMAWAELGTIAGAPKQRGLYISLGGQLF